MIKVVLCDDHAVVRRGIRDTLAEAVDIKVTGEAGGYAEVRQLLREVECDVLVFSDDVEARNLVVGLAADMQLRGLSGGALVNSAAAEALTSILIYMNKTYGADGAGIRFTNLTTAPPIPA